MVQFAVAEGLVWRVVDMYQHLDLGALSGPSDERQVAASTDTPVQIALVSLTDLALAVRSALNTPLLFQAGQVLLGRVCDRC